MVAINPAALRYPDAGVNVLGLAASLDIEFFKCDDRKWKDAPHSLMDEDQFLAALAREGKDVKVLYLDIEYMRPDDNVFYALYACGLPWEWLEDIEQKPSGEQPLLRSIEQEFATIIKDFVPSTGPLWWSFEAHYDVGGLVRGIVVPKPAWFEEMVRAFKFKFREQAPRLMPLISMHLGEQDSGSWRH